MATEHWSIHEHESDVSKLVVLNLDFVCPSKDRDINRQSRCVGGIIEAIRAWNHPNEILILKIISHQLSHDSKATNLDLNVPIRNFVLDRSDKDAASLTGDACTKCKIVIR